MNRRTKICVWIIAIGLANFLLYTMGYVCLYGEAINGHIVIEGGVKHYFLQSGLEVSRAVFIYSGVHSISIWPTVMAVMLSMLTLAKDRIAASMHSTVVRGRVMITLFAVVIGLISALLTFEFAHTFAHTFERPEIKSAESRPSAELKSLPLGRRYREAPSE
ncbi:MAG TPA: hypothetical protein VM098_01105 [Phycisphaerae bacterium]|nr:hypothetical protein [Phycisphaerae bacterium]